MACFVTILTRRVPLVEQELLTLLEHMSSSPLVFSGVRVSRSLVLSACFVDRCLSFFGDHCVICTSSIYGFWLSLWYLQTPLKLVLWSHSILEIIVNYYISKQNLRKRYFTMSISVHDDKCPASTKSIILWQFENEKHFLKCLIWNKSVNYL